MRHSPCSSKKIPALLIGWCFLALAFASLPALRAEPNSYQVSDRVETNISIYGWEKGTILEIGTGDRSGQLRILTDGRAQDNWVNLQKSSKYIRKIAGAAPALAAEGNQPPRLGKYEIQTFGPGGNYLYLGHFELLGGGKYRVSRKSSGDYFGEGTYTFEAASKSVQWLSGPYKDEAGWGGAFEVSREGKTHQIRLTRTTVATNSTDGK